MSNHRGEHALLATLATCAAACLLCLFLAFRLHLGMVHALLPYPFLACLLCAAVFVRLRMDRIATEERRAAAGSRDDPRERALFESSEATEALTAARTQAQFEKWMVPWVAPILAVIQGAWAWHLYRAGFIPPSTEAPLLLAATLIGGQSFLLFLFGRYLLGLGRTSGQIWLRGPGILVHLAALAGLLVSGAAVAAHAADPRIESVARVILIGGLAVLAAESAIRAVAEIYRPRKRQAACVSYESRLADLLADPAPWINNVAHALDYQFGFNVSETWFYRFLQGALVPLLVFQAMGLYLLSCLVFVGPQEEAVRERAGRPMENRWRLESGLHFKLPWPFETVQRFPARQLQVVRIGAPVDEHGHDGEPRLWTEGHHGETDLFLAAHIDDADRSTRQETAPVSLINISVPVEYRIRDVHAHAYSCADPGAALEHLVRAAVTREAASRDLVNLLASEQHEIPRRLMESIQAEADAWDLGIEIESVQLEGLHPPAAVAGAFEAVLSAQEEKRAAVSRARAYANRSLPLARAGAAAMGSKAEAYQGRRQALAAAETERFDSLVNVYERNPSIFQTRWYLRVLRDTLVDTRKYILSTDSADEVLEFNFEEKLHPDLFDFSSPSLKDTQP